EEYRDLQQDRQAAGQRIGADLLVERHGFLVKADLVVAELLAQLVLLGLQRLHLVDVDDGLGLQREEQSLDQYGQDQDGDAEIADHAVDPIQHIEDRLGEKPEPAEID